MIVICSAESFADHQIANDAHIHAPGLEPGGGGQVVLGGGGEGERPRVLVDAKAENGGLVRGQGQIPGMISAMMMAVVEPRV